jgi:hypothetical protein
LEKTLEYIEEFERENIHTQASFVALHVALQHGMEQEAMIFMDRIAQKAALNPEFQPRAHYFWPLLSSAGKARRTDGTGDFCSELVRRFRVFFSSAFSRGPKFGYRGHSNPKSDFRNIEYQVFERSHRYGRNSNFNFA